MVGLPRRGWIRIVEAFVAILLLMGAVGVFYAGGKFRSVDFSEEIYAQELAILQEVQSDPSLRAIILDVRQSDLPLSWEDFTNQGQYELGTLRSYLEERFPTQLTCSAKLCVLDDICGYTGSTPPEGISGIYAQAVTISADDIRYSPKQVKLFCWPK